MKRLAGALIVLAACGPRSRTLEVPMNAAPVEDASVAPPVVPAASVAPSRGPIEPGDVFVGKYTCAQGPTDLELKITDVRVPEPITGVRSNTGWLVFAEFQFTVPRGARGAYRMSGVYDARATVLKLSGTSWIKQPSDFVMVPISGKLRGRVYAGDVLAVGCTFFTTKRAEPDRAP